MVRVDGYGWSAERNWVWMMIGQKEIGFGWIRLGIGVQRDSAGYWGPNGFGCCGLGVGWFGYCGLA